MTLPSLDVVVLGEALIDVVHTSAGVAERPGGSPANVAVALGRLERATALVTQIADDDHGRLLRAWLEDAGVQVDAVGNPANTSTAAAHVDDEGNASYEFNLEWNPPAGLHTSPARILHIGSVATLDPGSDIVAAVVETAAPQTLITYDPNVRPALSGGHADALRRVERLVRAADVVKASTEDIAWLYPGQAPADVAAAWAGEGPALVVVTDGAAGAVAIGRAGSAHVGAAPATVVDTVGAGDTFMGALIDSILEIGTEVEELRSSLRSLSSATLTAVLGRCAAAAAITVSRQGMDPPTRTELMPAGANMKESA